MRRLLIPLLAFGAIGGFASGFAHLHHHRCGWSDERWNREELSEMAPAAQATPVQARSAAAPAPAQPMIIVIPVIAGGPSLQPQQAAQPIIIPMPAQAPAASAAPQVITLPISVQPQAQPAGTK